MALATVALARGGPAAGAVPTPDRRVLSVPGRGACRPRPHPPAAGGGPGQRCFPEHRLHGLPEETPSFATAWSCLSRPTTALRTGDRHRNVGGSVHLRDGRGCGSGCPPPPLPCCSSLSRRMPLLASPGAPAALPACSPSSLGTWIRSPTALQHCVCSHRQRGGEARLMSQVWGIACFEGRSHLLRWRCCVGSHDNQAADFEAL